jgi:hypothetical protein
MDPKARWLRFFMWAVTGACFALGITSPGVFTVPLGLLLVVFLTRTRGNGHELLGLLEGAAAIIVLIGALNLDYRSCTAESHLVRGGPSCGGVNGPPWLAAGVMLMLLAVIAFWRWGSPGRNAPSGEVSSSLPG